EYPQPDYNYRVETSTQRRLYPTALSPSDYSGMHKTIGCTPLAYPWYDQHRLGVGLAPFPTASQVHLSAGPEHADSPAFIPQQGDSVLQVPQSRRSSSYDEIKDFAGTQVPYTPSVHCDRRLQFLNLQYPPLSLNVLRACLVLQGGGLSVRLEGDHPPLYGETNPYMLQQDRGSAKHK
ncbi:hypothetical protein LTR49_026519, partial [Elasticomyces elasticus]